MNIKVSDEPKERERQLIWRYEQNQLVCATILTSCLLKKILNILSLFGKNVSARVWWGADESLEICSTEATSTRSFEDAALSLRLAFHPPSKRRLEHWRLRLKLLPEIQSCSAFCLHDGFLQWCRQTVGVSRAACSIYTLSCFLLFPVWCWGIMSVHTYDSFLCLLFPSRPARLLIGQHFCMVRIWHVLDSVWLHFFRLHVDGDLKHARVDFILFCFCYWKWKISI